MILDQPERSGSVIYDGQSRLWIDVRIHSSLATYACGAMETERTLLTHLQRGCGKKKKLSMVAVITPRTSRSHTLDVVRQHDKL